MHWKGNNAADEIAKLSRPKLQFKEKEQQTSHLRHTCEKNTHRSLLQKP